LPIGPDYSRAFGGNETVGISIEGKAIVSSCSLHDSFVPCACELWTGLHMRRYSNEEIPAYLNRAGHRSR
jgi:hypothetical protein